MELQTMRSMWDERSRHWDLWGAKIKKN